MKKITTANQRPRYKETSENCPTASPSSDKFDLQGKDVMNHLDLTLTKFNMLGVKPYVNEVEELNFLVKYKK